ncbi:hypothetical protein Ciccas_004413 [Cichlidogyrus casuarinus]|uniref:Uncharacterized protein n=1 Tax=Cichlidogyrus casuarinus TaxID=1844966 RepID=A0ABD2QBK2_9PLAT
MLTNESTSLNMFSNLDSGSTLNPKTYEPLLTYYNQTAKLSLGDTLSELEIATVLNEVSSVLAKWNDAAQSSDVFRLFWRFISQDLDRLAANQSSKVTIHDFFDTCTFSDQQLLTAVQQFLLRIPIQVLSQGMQLELRSLQRKSIFFFFRLLGLLLKRELNSLPSMELIFSFVKDIFRKSCEKSFADLAWDTSQLISLHVSFLAVFHLIITDFSSINVAICKAPVFHDFCDLFTLLTE